MYILWGLMFFLPATLVGCLVALFSEFYIRKLIPNKLSSVDKTRVSPVIILAWFIAWSGLVASWSIFLLSTASKLNTTLASYMVPIVMWVLFALIPTLILIFKKFTCVSNIRKAIFFSYAVALPAMLLVALIYVLPGGSFLEGSVDIQFINAILHLFFTPLCIVLFIAFMRMGMILKSIFQVIITLFLYVIFSVLFFVVLPLNPGAENTVGALIPLWGPGVLSIGSVIALRRL